MNPLAGVAELFQGPVETCAGHLLKLYGVNNLHLPVDDGHGDHVEQNMNELPTEYECPQNMNELLQISRPGALETSFVAGVVDLRGKDLGHRQGCFVSLVTCYSQRGHMVS